MLANTVSLVERRASERRATSKAARQLSATSKGAQENLWRDPLKLISRRSFDVKVGRLITQPPEQQLPEQVPTEAKSAPVSASARSSKSSRNTSVSASSKQPPASEPRRPSTAGIMSALNEISIAAASGDRDFEEELRNQVVQPPKLLVHLTGLRELQLRQEAASLHLSAEAKPQLGLETAGSRLAHNAFVLDVLSQHFRSYSTFFRELSKDNEACANLLRKLAADARPWKHKLRAAKRDAAVANLRASAEWQQRLDEARAETLKARKREQELLTKLDKIYEENARLQALRGEAEDTKKEQLRANVALTEAITRVQREAQSLKSRTGSYNDTISGLKLKLADAENSRILLERALETAQDAMSEAISPETYAKVLHELNEKTKEVEATKNDLQLMVTTYAAKLDEVSQLKKQLQIVSFVGARELFLEGSLPPVLNDGGVEVQKLEGRVTPRPDWNSAMECALLPKGKTEVDATGAAEKDDGSSTPHDFDPSKFSSVQLLAMATARHQQLREELRMLRAIIDIDIDADLKERRDEDSFVALGTDASVPKYLRFQGRVRNRHLPKRQIEELVKQVWEEKYQQDEKAATMHLVDYLFIFLRNKHTDQHVIADWGYNFLSGLKKYRYDADIDMFLRILEGELPQGVYQDQNNLLERLEKEIENEAQRDEIETNVLQQLLRDFFGTSKRKERLRELLKALKVDDPRRQVQWPALFEEDEDGNQGTFVEMLRDQHLEEIDEFYGDLEEALREHATSNGLLSVSQARQSILALDPGKSLQECNSILCEGIGIEQSQSTALRADQVFHIDAFVHRLRTSNLLFKRASVTN
ncbi:MAG: hypothetical protein MHM6MM_003488 [Cercozoa sp. M6MM]